MRTFGVVSMLLASFLIGASADGKIPPQPEVASGITQKQLRETVRKLEAAMKAETAERKRADARNTVTISDLLGELIKTQDELARQATRERLALAAIQAANEQRVLRMQAAIQAANERRTLRMQATMAGDTALFIMCLVCLWFVDNARPIKGKLRAIRPAQVRVLKPIS